MISIDAGGSSLTPSLARLLLNKVRMKLRVAEIKSLDYTFKMNVTQQAAWDNCELVVNRISDAALGKSTLGGITIETNFDMSKDRIVLEDRFASQRVAEITNLAIPNGYEE